VRQLTLLQIDPTAATAPSADLVAWSRLGSAYNALVRPTSDLGLVLAGMGRLARHHEGTRAWIGHNASFRRDILDLLGRERAPATALGIARQQSTTMPIEPVEAGEPAVVEGTAGEWRVDPEALDQDFEGRTALLSQFDRLVYDRRRTEELFDFEYTLEMYKSAAKRRWGYFALPVLHNDRLVGNVDATATARPPCCGCMRSTRTSGSPARWLGPCGRARGPSRVARAGCPRANLG
jgi:hypothetical protein